MSNLDFEPFYDFLHQELDALSVDKPTLTINPAYEQAQSKKQRRSLRKFLEVLKMPVPSPKPTFAGETDYINTDLLPRVIIEPEFLFDFDDKQKKKIAFNLDVDPEDKQNILLNATFHNGYVGQANLSLVHLEKELSNIMHGDRSKRLEHSPLFKDAIGNMLREFTYNYRARGEMFIQLGVQYEMSAGLGIIRDTKTDQDVGTFESFFYRTDAKDKSEYIIGDVILSGRTEKDLEDVRRFVYYFFDLNEGRIYSIEPVKWGTTQHGEVTDFSIKLHDVNIHIENMEDDHPKLELVRQAQETKSVIRSFKADPLFDEEFQRFKEPRMALIKSSQESAKKQKMVNMFADIDL
ncbi:hypothetical protein SAMN02799624_05301 [Paenibacillus sp. UNC496MF]|uniref:hypothetical protein n=1 Tax=Paenibacillus sp. UNC496MF TaxID=1502753 RepID=UPI0008EB0530|nr:hypothetical protein [Paenibacillus sp. UNC496MF]SFJ63788.1 hypothetical protein SAMN02799624_05301 [Paenibacillus sp. UNC496MF]